MCSVFSYNKFLGTTQIMKTVNDNRCYQLLCSSVFEKKVGVEYAYQLEFLSFFYI